MNLKSITNIEDVQVHTLFKHRRKRSVPDAAHTAVGYRHTQVHTLLRLRALMCNSKSNE